MQYLKRNTKYSILVFLIIFLSITISISTFSKTKNYFSHDDNPQFLSTTSSRPEVQTININTVSQDEIIKVLKISELLDQKIINLRNGLSGFKEPKDLLKIPELTNIDLREWEEKGIVIDIS